MKANKMNTDDAWARDSTGFELCRIAMSENRFRFLLRVIRFDDKATRNERLRQDKLAAVRLILDTFVKNCQKHYSPSEYITVDEKLDAFRGKCNFRQYIPSKHNKYGIKLFALVDSKMFYTCNLEIYSGKNPEGPYNVSNSPSDVVERLCEPIKGTGRNVTMDNWFTSYSLALKLLQQFRLTIVGTLKRNKKEIPSEFVISRGRNVHTSVFGFQSEMTLLSYKPKANKVVLMLSTLHHDANIDDSTGELKKPEMIMFYNMTKGGVDMMDEMTATYNCARNSRRWPMVIFYSLLNIGAINSQIIHFANGNASKVKSRRHFLKTLSLDLIEEMVKVRTVSGRMPCEIKEKASDIFNLLEPGPSKKPKIGERPLCKKCQKEKKDRKTIQHCQYCFAFLWRFHISQRRLCGEGASISPAIIIDEHLTNLNSILANSGYDPANIYNADETGLFFQLIPDRTLAHKDESCRGVKRMKQRITVLLCCNSTGTDKRRLLIIGKSAKPRCFRNFSPHFYCTYTSNSKAWMTSNIFQEWLLQFNKQLVSEGRRILLLLDNATSHCVPNDGLSNIKIHFLPPNMTASLQPLDNGIIKSFKAQYRKLQLQKMVELADAHLPTELRLDYAVRYCKMAWDSVTPSATAGITQALFASLLLLQLSLLNMEICSIAFATSSLLHQRI
ncbi:hypothetical protein LAZ67_1001867 [Cordylochernes scorpioides]|uniref:Transposase n=1 Tax=Cordylochernes scorpioides TaxID=51811 RepID=A0ABY6JW26_9ARAC|nr:hypothetical protein LAZ67_1001867 [Cordylochernes scorpioides]